MAAWDLRNEWGKSRFDGLVPRPIDHPGWGNPRSIERQPRPPTLPTADSNVLSLG